MNNKQQQVNLVSKQQPMEEEQIILPKPQFNLIDIFAQLRSLSKERLDTQENQEEGQSIKGLKFISGKLAKLFSKNRKLPYNQISKILIDNFASEQKDERNIKRRVYDAINVLVAAQVFQKKGNFIEMQKNKIKLKKEGQKKQDIANRLAQLKMVLAAKRQRLNKIKKQFQNIQKLISRNQKQKLRLKDNNQQSKIQGVKIVICSTDANELFSCNNLKIKWETALKQNSLKKQSRSNVKSSKNMKNSKQKNGQTLQIEISDKSKVQVKSFLQVLDYVIE